MNSLFIGPFTIVQKFGSNVYSLKDSNNKVYQCVYRKSFRKLPNKESVKELEITQIRRKKNN